MPVDEENTAKLNHAITVKTANLAEPAASRSAGGVRKEYILPSCIGSLLRNFETS